MNAAHTPTPRTDAEKRWAMDVNGSNEVVCADFARQLERELAEAQDQIDDLTAAGIHSCGNNCKRPNCVLRRELAELSLHVNLCHDALGECRGSDTSELWRFFESAKQRDERLRVAERELAEARKLAEERERHMKELREHYGIGPRDVMSELRKELAEATKQRDALAVALRALKELGPPSKAKDTITTALATLKGRGE
jgi:hypothetical protein